jgi:macrolide-specific efflux system membrane fusion protein
MAGTVVAVEARAGQTLNAAYQTPNILRIADLSVMTVWTDVSEADVRQISPGMSVHFTTLGRGRDHAVRRWQGRVRQVLPGGSASPAQATKAVTYTVLFDVDNADRELLPQMTAQVVFVTAQVDSAVVVPLSALAPDSGPQGPSVRVLAASGRPEVRSLRLGVRSRSEAQVLDGLQVGEALITGESQVGGTSRWLQW